MPKIVPDAQIFEAVIQLIELYGFAGMTTKQIAKVAQVNEVTIFRKYGSKAQLVKQAIIYYAFAAVIETAVTYTGNIEADLHQVVAAYQKSAELHAKIFSIMLSEIARFPELKDVLNAPLGIVAEIAQLLERYQAEGVLRPENPFQAAGALIGPLVINAMLRKAQVMNVDQPVDLDEHVAAYIYGHIAQKT